MLLIRFENNGKVALLCVLDFLHGKGVALWQWASRIVRADLLNRDILPVDGLDRLQRVFLVAALEDHTVYSVQCLNKADAVAVDPVIYSVKSTHILLLTRSAAQRRRRRTMCAV